MPKFIQDDIYEFRVHHQCAIKQDNCIVFTNKIVKKNNKNIDVPKNRLAVFKYDNLTELSKYRRASNFNPRVFENARQCVICYDNSSCKHEYAVCEHCLITICHDCYYEKMSLCPYCRQSANYTTISKSKYTNLFQELLHILALKKKKVMIIDKCKKEFFKDRNIIRIARHEHHIKPKYINMFNNSVDGLIILYKHQINCFTKINTDIVINFTDSNVDIELGYLNLDAKTHVYCFLSRVDQVIRD